MDDAPRPEGTRDQDEGARPPGAPQRVALRQEASGPMLKPLAADEEAAPPRAGKYQVQGEIARGGVGIVLQGFDTQLGRAVALKLLRKRYEGDELVRQRFLEEAQIGGQLQHPGITPVYDLDPNAERPYFAMKLIKGRTLAALLTEEAAAPGARLRFLRVFEQVCLTMAYAHARGVIHRDLKPSNVMVGAFGEVQVVDWGMGKVLGSGGVADEERAIKRGQTVVSTVRSHSGPGSSHSMVGSVMGTPGYMPPEQARGSVDDMDERSDVFSLGAILCEILTGQPPYVGEPMEQLQMAARADLKGAMERLDGCDADEELKTIVRDCLVAAIPARPRDAGQLAARVGQHLASLDDRKRVAEIAAAEERVKAAHARRSQRLTLALAATVLVSLLAGGGAWIGLQRSARAREDRAAEKVRAALEEMATLRGQEDWDGAEAAAERAMQLADEAPTELRERAASARTALLAAAGEARAHEAMLRGNDTLLEGLSDVRKPESSGKLYAVDWARVDGDYATCFRAQGLDPDAGTVEEAAASLRARGIPADLAAWLDDWALVRQRAERRDEAARLLRVAELVDPDPGRLRVRDAIREGDADRLAGFVDAPWMADAPAITCGLLAEALARSGRHEAAEAVLHAAYERFPTDFLITIDLARALVKIGRNAEASRAYAAARALRPDHVETLHELGITLGFAEDHEGALRLFEEAVRLRPEDGHMRFHVGSSLLHLGRYEEAVQAFREAVRLSPGYALGYLELAETLFRLHRTEELGQVAADGLANATDLRPITRVGLVGFREHGGQPGDPAETEAVYRSAIEEEPTSGYLHVEFAKWLLQQGRRREALGQAREAARVEPDSPGVHKVRGVILQLLGLEEWAEVLDRAHRLDPDDPAPLPGVASLAMSEGRIGEAVQAWEQAMAGGGNRADLYALGNVYLSQQRFGDAVRSMERALQVPGVVGMMGQAPLADGPIHAQVGAVLMLAARPEEALVHIRAALEAGEPEAEAHCNLGRALQQLGRYEEAVAELERGHELGSARRTWSYPSRLWLAEARRWLEREPELRALAEGAREPQTAIEARDAALYAVARGRDRDAVRLFRRAEKIDDVVMGDLGPGADGRSVASVVFEASIAACRLLAAGAEGEEAAALRADVLRWLQAELRGLEYLLRSPLGGFSPADAPRLRAHLGRLLSHPALAPMREEKLVDQLPDDDQITEVYTVWRILRRVFHKLPAPMPNPR